MPDGGGSLSQIDPFQTMPFVDPPTSNGTDTATDGTHAYWISVFWGGALDVTRSDITASCGVFGGAGTACPLVDVAASRIAVDDTYLYVYGNDGTIYRAFK
jgi:hypothetical protein